MGLKLKSDRKEKIMVAYLGDNAIYVKNDDKLVYKVESVEIYDNYNSLRLNLKLVCGWDYVNPDYNDVQGWCPADRFIEDVQSEMEICYFLKESVKECLEDNGYEILEKNPLKCWNCCRNN